MRTATFTFSLLAAVGAAAPDALAQGGSACPRATAPTRTNAAIVSVARLGPRDTVASATVCLYAGAAGTTFGSYHGTLTYDTLAVRVIDVRHAASGSRMENVKAPGTIAFAGASPTGFAPGELLVVRLRLTRRGRVPRMILRMLELNDATGRSLLASLDVDSLGAGAPQARGVSSCRMGRPYIASLAPSEIDLSSGDRQPVVIVGCGFGVTNTLKVGPVTIPGVPSTDRGRRIHFVVPLELPAGGEASPRRMPTGRMDLTVTNANGTSNIMSLVLR